MVLPWRGAFKRRFAFLCGVCLLLCFGVTLGLYFKLRRSCGESGESAVLVPPRQGTRNAENWVAELSLSVILLLNALQFGCGQSTLINDCRQSSA